MSGQALLHEVLLALVGHTGDLIQPVLHGVQSSALEPLRWVVRGLALVDEAPVSDAERAAIDGILKCGYHYTSILAFVQSVDAGATLVASGGGGPRLPSAAKLSTVAENVAAIRRLDAQQSRSVYSAASQMLSPRKQNPRTSSSQADADESSASASAAAAASSRDGWMMVAKPAALSEEAEPKSVGLYLRALVLGLDELLSGYRTLVLRIEQEILSESALDPQSTTPGGRPVVCIDFGLTKLTLMLRQYAVILPALHDMIKEITAAPATSSSTTNTSAAAAAASPAPSTTDSRYSTHSIHGCSLITFLHGHSQTGVPLLSGVFSRLVAHLDRVMLHQVVQWCFFGALVDPFDEFWIRDRERLRAATTKGAREEDLGAAAVDGFAGFDTAQFFRTKSSSFSSSSSHPAHGKVSVVDHDPSSFDWDASFLLLPSLLPLPYFPSSSLTHAILFCGKAVRILEEGERARAERRRRREGRERRRRIVGLTAAAGATGGGGGGGSTTKNRRTASMAGLISPQTNGAKPAAATAAAARDGASLTEECAPLLQQFHALLRPQQQQQQHPQPPPQHQQPAASAAPTFLSSLTTFESLCSSLTAMLSRRLYHFLLRRPQGLLVHLDHLRRFVLCSDAVFVGAFLDLACGTLARQPTARTDKDLAAHSGPVKAALREALKAGEDDDEGESEEEEEEEDDDAAASRDPALLSSRSSLALYPLGHLSFSIDPGLVTPSASASTGSLAPGTGSSAWRALKAEYSVASPLNLILTPAILGQYNALFRFLLALRRVQHLLREMWLPCQGAWRREKARGGARTMAFQLLRANMSFLIDTLNAYVHVDVIQRLWSDLLQRVDKPSTGSGGGDFESVRKAHEDYVHQVSGHCFLRDRVVSGALYDLFETCLQFHRAATTSSPTTGSASSSSSSSSASASSLMSTAVFTRLSGEWERQSCFLFTVLSRKTDFTGGSSSFLHALVSRLDFNGYYTRVSRELGLNKAGKQTVPQQRGTVLSQQGIQSSLARATPGVGTSSSSSTALTLSTSLPSTRPSALTPSTAALVGLTQHLTRAPPSSFVPSHLHTASSSSSSSHAADFASGTTRPSSARNAAATTATPSADWQRRPQTTRNAPPSDEPTSY